MALDDHVAGTAGSSEGDAVGVGVVCVACVAAGAVGVCCVAAEAGDEFAEDGTEKSEAAWDC